MRYIFIKIIQINFGFRKNVQKSLPAAVAEVLLLRAVAVDSGLFLSLFLVGIVVVTVAGEPETADLSTSGRISNDMSSKLGFLAF